MIQYRRNCGLPVGETGRPDASGNPDYDAEVLFAWIQEEKAKQNAKGGKQKKAVVNLQRSFQRSIEIVEQAFAIPDGWKWVRFGDVINIAKNIIDSSDYKTMIQVSPDDIEKCTGISLYPLRTKLNYDYVKYLMLPDYFDLEVYKFDNRVKMPK